MRKGCWVQDVGWSESFTVSRVCANSRQGAPVEDGLDFRDNCGEDVDIQGLSCLQRFDVSLEQSHDSFPNTPIVSGVGGDESPFYPFLHQSIVHFFSDSLHFAFDFSVCAFQIGAIV